MKSDDIIISNILEIKTINLLSSPKETRTSSSTDSSDSSPSDLRRRLEDLPSPNEFVSLTDRVAGHDRQICRRREAFLHLHGVANRIEENDEWEEREQRAGLKSSLEASRPKDARARRRARVYLKSSLDRDDKTMVISQADASIDSFKIDNNELNPTQPFENQSAQDRLRLPTIALRGQSRSSSLSEPSSTRFLHHSNDESSDVKCKTAFNSYRSFTPREKLKSIHLPSVSPFSLSSIQPRKFGGYRPSSGIIMKNLSSGSESESTNDMSRALSSARKIGNATATLELSSPESAVVSSVNGPIKKMPIMSARSDITESILPNLLPSSRSLDSNDLNHQATHNISRNYIGQVNRGGTKICNDLENTLIKPIFHGRVSHDEFTAKTFDRLRQVKPKYEDTRYQQQETPQTFFARNFMPETAELVTNTYNDQVIRNEPAMKVCNKFKQVEPQFEDIQDRRGEEVENNQRVPLKIHPDDVRHRFEFNSPTVESKFEVDALENNGDALDVAKWNRSTSLYAREAVDTSRVETIQNVSEEASSSRTSEPYGSEDRSRSSCAAKIYFPGDARNDPSNKCDQEIVTTVPTLILNSQDISYSTSAGSREYSAARSLDPHALIKALSDVSVMEKKQDEHASRKYEGFHSDKVTIDAKGKTWRVSRSPESPRKSLPRVSSRIPVRISSNKILSPNNKFPECYKPENSNDIANYEESKFTERNDESIYQRSSRNSFDRDSSMKSRNEDTEVTFAEGVFTPGNETAGFEINDRALGSLTSSNPQSSRSTPFGDFTYEKMQRACLSERKFQRETCSPVVFYETTYSDNRDYARMNDDVQSRSDRSTFRKSVDTTNATESLDLSKYKKTEWSQIESLKNGEDNITWRTEDECASIKDEENLEVAKDKHRVSHDEVPDELRSQEKGDDSLAMSLKTQRTNSEILKGNNRKRHAEDDLKFKNDRINFNHNLEIAKNAQSENLTFEMRETQQLSTFSARISSSTLNLNCEPKRKKKRSQERFPFTISEATGVLSEEHEDANDYQSPDKTSDKKIDDRTQESIVYQLKTHPSITRLAASGMEDAIADILHCVAQEKKENSRFSKSKLKAFLGVFSWKRKEPKQLKTSDPTSSTKIIYENNACQADSKADSCSEGSSEARKMYTDNCWIDRHAAGSKSALVSSWETLKKTESLHAIPQHLSRRYDRDDLWVRDIKDPPSGEKKETPQKQNKASEESPAKDRYSIFLAKNPQSEPSMFNYNNSSKNERMPISDHVILSDGKSKRSIDRNVSSNFICEAEEIEEELTDCLCWKLCHIIAPSRYRSSMKEQVSGTGTRKSDSLLQKRKK